MSKEDIETRTENIMPKWSFWGDGVILVSKKEWYKSRNKIVSILKQMSRSKKQIMENRVPK